VESDRRNAWKPDQVIIPIAAMVGYLLGSFAKDWFPEVNQIIVRLVAGVIVGLAALAFSVLLKRNRRRHS
jgi:membrane protein DedA with SNARE-associated domain